MCKIYMLKKEKAGKIAYASGIFFSEKNIFTIILHTYIDAPCKSLVYKNLQRFQIPHKPTLILH